MPAIADQIDHDVLVEPHSVIERQPAHEHDRFRVVGIHMEDRRLDHLGDIAAVQSGACVTGFAGRKADLVIHDDVKRAAGRKTSRLRELQRFHDNALAGKGCIPVNQDRNDFDSGAVAATFLACSHRALDDRVDDFEMRGIEGEHHMHIAACGAQIRRKALVILDVTRAFHRGKIDVALELGKKRRRRLAEHVDQHVQASTVRHRDDDVLDASCSTALHQIIQQWDQGIATFQ